MLRPDAVKRQGYPPRGGRMALFLGTAAYLCNVAIGVMAQFFGRKFGIWHHVAYAVVCVTGGFAILTAFHPALLLTAGALVSFPRAKPRTPWHPLLAAVGLLGYLGAWLGTGGGA